VNTIPIAVLIGVTCAFTWSCDRAAGAPTAGFWFNGDRFVVPNGLMSAFDEPIEDAEVESIKQLARAEIERAFSGLRIAIIPSPHAFWSVQVLQSLPVRRNKQLPIAGESLALGLLGGTGTVGFDIVATKAIRYAPDGASRQRVLEGIGRGIGRVAVHEFMHQMLGAAAGDNAADSNSYEYGSPDRASQYYGELHWSTAWPLLHEKFGT
jgi:hypothetical protein